MNVQIDTSIFMAEMNKSVNKHMQVLHLLFFIYLCYIAMRFSLILSKRTLL